MNPKLFHRLLTFSLFGIALWFFGNLYEAVVIVPNLLENSVAKAHHWQAFFTATNPIFFYVPLAPLATIVAAVLYHKTKDDPILKKRLGRAAGSSLLALVLGIGIITQINLKLFFGDLDKYTASIHTLSVWWNVLNGLRVVLLGIAVGQLFGAYTQNLQPPHDSYTRETTT